MAISAAMSVWGLYQYDSTIFDDFVVPQALSKDQICENILIESTSLEVLYPDPVFMRRAIKIWSERRAPIWAKMQQTTGYTYDPIYNYDRYETETVENSETTGSSESHSTQRDIQNTGTETRVIDHDTATSGSSTQTDSKTAYNASTFAATTKTDRSGSDTITDDTTDTLTHNTKTDDDTTATISSEQEKTGTIERTHRAYGNIGVTTTQEMIRQEREIVQFDLVKIITTEFIDKFCIAVY